MRRLASFSLLCLVLAVTPALADSRAADRDAADRDAGDHHAADASQFGEPVGEGELTAISTILDDPAGWEGREVRVAGEVTEVCTLQGCWMELEDDGARLRVKVDDGVIVFPADAPGHRAVARGTVERIELDRERYEGWMRHLADEQGRDFDPASIGDGPYEIVRIRGLGAEIQGAELETAETEG